MYNPSVCTSKTWFWLLGVFAYLAGVKAAVGIHALFIHGSTHTQVCLFQENLVRQQSGDDQIFDVSPRGRQHSRRWSGKAQVGCSS